MAYGEKTEIKLDSEADIRHWTRELNVSERDLKEAVKVMGNRVEDVVRYLNGRGAGSQSSMAPERQSPQGPT